MARNLYGGAGQERNYWAQHALNVIKDNYGVDAYIKSKNLLKFGRNDDVDNSASDQTIMQLPGSEVAETYATTNAIDTISSSDSGDTGITIYIEGHTVDGSGNFTFVVQTATLNGSDATTKVTLSTPLARISRAYNSSGTLLAGTVYIYEDGATTTPGVPDTDADVHATIQPIAQQTLKAATTFSYQDYGVITEIYGGVNKKTSAVVDVKLRVRLKGGIFRTQFVNSVGQGGNFAIELRPYFIVPANADVIMVANSGVDNVSVSAGFNSLIALAR